MKSTDLPPRSVREILIARRLELDLPIDEVARRCGLTPAQWDAIESGNGALAAGDIDRVARGLTLPVEILQKPSICPGAPSRNVDNATIQWGVNPQEVPATRTLQQDVTANDDGGCRIAVTIPRPPKSGSAVSDARGSPSGTLPDAPRGTFLPKGDIVAGKNDAVYHVHSYHTKVPPDAVAPFIEEFTARGESVLDPFCGSGMTGVAAVRLGRDAILSDLSPAAVHIAGNYCTPCEPSSFERAADRVIDRTRTTMEWLYEANGGMNLIEYAVWSDVFRCPSCGKDVSYWDATYDPDRNALRPMSICPWCHEIFVKSTTTWLREEPVLVSLSAGGGARRRVVRPMNDTERSHLAEIESIPIPYWYPHAAFSPEREMWRASHRAMGIDRVDQFFTRRNLHALAALHHSIIDEPDDRLRRALLFAFTAIVNRASRRYQWNAKRPTNVMHGTLYISSLRYEFNVASLFLRKVSAIRRYFAELGEPMGRASVRLSSATDLGWLGDGSIDYVFTDPPFGANIYYADSSFLWEAWLDQFTDQRLEAVVNRRLPPGHGGKDIDGYRELLTRSFGEVHRVLKSGGHASIVFNNTDDRVWRAIQSSVQDAGFRVIDTTSLDKKHRSIKGVKGELGEEQVAIIDVIVTVRKDRTVVPGREPVVADVGAIVSKVLRDHLGALEGRADKPVTRRRTEYLYSLAIRALLERGVPVAQFSMDTVECILATIAERRADGWYVGTKAT